MGNLAGVFETLSQRKHGPQCGVSLVLQSLSPDDAKTLNEVLNNRDISSTIIEQALIQYGHKVSRATIANHRRRGNGGCRCEQ